MPKPTDLEEPVEEIDDEPTKSDEEIEEELEEQSESTLDQNFSTENELAREAVRVLNPLETKIVSSSSQMIEMDQIDSTYDDLSGKAKQKGESPRTEKAREDARDYRQEQVGTQKRKGRLWARAKGANLLLALITTSTSVASVLIAIFAASRSLNGQAPEKTEGLTDKQKKMLKDQVKRWRDLPDGEVWESMETYCDRWNPSWQAQILMVDTIKKLAASAPPGWTWRDDDLADLVDQTASAYADFQPGDGQAKSRAVYTSVAAITYDGITPESPEPLPRVLAADVADLALTQIALRQETAEGNKT